MTPRRNITRRKACTRHRGIGPSDRWLPAANVAAALGLASALCSISAEGAIVGAGLLMATAMLVHTAGLAPSVAGLGVRTSPDMGCGRPLALAMEGRSTTYRDVDGMPASPRGSEPASTGWLDPEYVPNDWLRNTRAARQPAWEHALHRGLDIVASLSLLLLTLPLLLLVAVAIKLDSRGPVFYRQERVGRAHRIFSILKFRSMTVDAEKPGTAVWASVGDSRVTRIGRVLRHYRIDEIPQAINILCGDMSFVGPRPERPGIVKELIAAIPHYADREIVRPGLTGWAQVRYPYGASIEDARNKLAYDMWYIQKRSIWLDLRIILATGRVVIGQVGAR